MAATSQCRQNYHEESEEGVNRQINMELFASYTYLSMIPPYSPVYSQAYFFDRDDVAFPGFHAYFKKQSDEEREHAQKLMKFQNQRGGRLLLAPVLKPDMDEWGSPLEAVRAALQLEKTVNQALLDLHRQAGLCGDAQMCDFIETEFLTEQVEAIKELGDMVTRLERCGPGLGEHIFDQQLKT